LLKSKIWSKNQIYNPKQQGYGPKNRYDPKQQGYGPKNRYDPKQQGYGPKTRYMIQSSKDMVQKQDI
jgi:hypothetical protein